MTPITEEIQQLSNIQHKSKVEIWNSIARSIAFRLSYDIIRGKLNMLKN